MKLRPFSHFLLSLTYQMCRELRMEKRRPANSSTGTVGSKEMKRYSKSLNTSKRAWLHSHTLSKHWCRLSNHILVIAKSPKRIHNAHTVSSSFLPSPRKTVQVSYKLQKIASINKSEYLCHFFPTWAAVMLFDTVHAS